MPILQEACTGRIILLPDDMPDGPEARLAPCAEKFIDAIPSVKADAKTMRLQNAVGIRKGRKDSGAAAVVVFDRLPAPVAIVHKIGRVGDDKIDGCGRQGL